MRRAIAIVTLAFISQRCVAQDFAYADKLYVQQETRLDWMYPLLERSPAEPPQGLLEGYSTRGQSYEFYGPPSASDAGPYALVVFVSPQSRPVGWPFFEPACRNAGMLFAGVRDAGNGAPMARRVRAVLDVLDDVRRRHRIDPDRTYLAGFSGGAAVACQTAFRVPEYFGGVVCIGHAPKLPDSPAVRTRVAERLSVAIACGERDPAAPWVSELMVPTLRTLGVRTEAELIARQGHNMPPAESLAASLAWLEEGLGDRRALAKSYPASSLAGAPSRAQWAQRLLAEAQGRLGEPRLVDSGLAQLEWINARWPDLAESKTAAKLAAEVAARPDRPWEATRARQRVKLLVVQAAGYERLARRGGVEEFQQAGLVRRAAELWGQVRDESQRAEEVAQARERLAALAPQLDRNAAEPVMLPLGRVRFKVTGKVTLGEAIGYLRGAVAGLGYRLEFDQEALKAAGVDFDKVRTLNMPAATFEQVERRLLRPAGLKTQRVKNVIRIVPVADDDKALGKPQEEVTSATAKPS
jgi:predicted esterase